MSDNRTPEEFRDDAVAAYEEATGQLPDTRDFVYIEDHVKEYFPEEKK